MSDCGSSLGEAMSDSEVGSEGREPIVQVGAPVPQARAPEVAHEQLGSPETVDVTSRMRRALIAMPGDCIAAPPIGVSLRPPGADTTLPDHDDHALSLRIERSDRATHRASIRLTSP
jgi:hypothetical protein